jgi:hypothetical protein
MAEEPLRMTLADESDGLAPSTVSALAAWQAALEALRVACAVAESHVPPLGVRFTAVERAGRAVCALLELRSREAGEQCRVLTGIRQTCDAVAGVRQEREETRLAGARGAVTVLVSRYRAREAELVALRAQLDAARDENTRLREAIPSGYAR